MIREVNGVPISDHMVRRLGQIAEKGSISAAGCRNCHNLTMERIADAGLIGLDRQGRWTLTESGLRFLADVIGGRR